MSNLTKGSNGFGLVEAMFSVAIFIGALTVIVGAYLYGQQESLNSAHRAQAVMLAEQAFEATRSMSYDDFASLSDGDYGLQVSGGTWQLTGSPESTDDYTRTITVTTVNSNKKQVEIHVSYRGKEFSQTVQFTQWERDNPNPSCDSAAPTLAGSLSVGDGPGLTRMQTQGDYAYVTTDAGDDDLLVIDISDPRRPVQVDALALSGTPTNIFLSGNYAFITSTGDNDELQIVDITDPEAVSFLSSHNITGSSDATGVYVSGNTAYVTLDGDSEFVSVDIDDPALPVTEGSLDLGAQANEVVVSGGYAFVVTEGNAESTSCVNASNVSYHVPMRASASGTYPYAGSISDTAQLYSIGDYEEGSLTVPLSFTSIPSGLSDPVFSVTFSDLDILYKGVRTAAGSGSAPADYCTESNDTILDENTGILWVMGGNGGSEIQVTSNGANWKVEMSGQPTKNFPKADVLAIRIYGGNGKDNIQANINFPVYVSGGNGNDEIQTGSGDDTLYGGNGKDNIQANDGNDILIGGNGNDTLNGGSGINTIDQGGDAGSCAAPDCTLDDYAGNWMFFNEQFELTDNSDNSIATIPSIHSEPEVTSDRYTTICDKSVPQTKSIALNVLEPYTLSGDYLGACVTTEDLGVNDSDFNGGFSWSYDISNELITGSSLTLKAKFTSHTELMYGCSMQPTTTQDSMSSISLCGTIAANADGRLVVVDLSVANLPAQAYSLPLTTGQGSADAIAIDGNTLYVGQGTYFHTIDISTPASPVILDSIDLGGEIDDIALQKNCSNGFITVATYNDEAELQIVDVTNPSDLSLAASLDLESSGSLRGIAYSSDNDRIIGGKTLESSQDFITVAPN